MKIKNLLWILGIIPIIFILFVCINRYYYNNAQTSEHNLKVLRDSIQTLTLKSGEQVSTINSYILEKKELEQYLDISKSEIKELEKKIGKISYISNIKTVTKYDSIYITDTITIHQDNSLSFNINYYDDWLEFNGKTNIKDSIATTTIDKISIPVPLQVGITNDYKIWVKSKNPYLTITSLDGAVISGSRLNKKQKHFGIGVSAGYGIQYDLINKKIGTGPYIGIGINYNFIVF
jgi:hypothetical protein